MYNSKEKLAELIHCIKNFQSISESQLTKLSHNAKVANLRLETNQFGDVSWEVKVALSTEQRRAYLIYELATVLLIRKLELTNPTSPKLQRIYEKWDYYFDEEYPRLYKNSSVWKYYYDTLNLYDDRFLATSFTLDELKQLNAALNRKYLEWKYTYEFRNPEYNKNIIEVCANGLLSDFVNTH